MSGKLYINPDELAEKLKASRKEKGIKQEDLATALSVSRQTVIEWEKGNVTPKSDYLIALCNLYDKDMDYFIGRLEEPTHDIKFICDQTGLSTRAVLKLRQMKQADQTTALQIISDILTAPDFDEILACFLDLYTNALQQKDMNLLKSTVSENEMSALVKSLDTSDIIEKSEKYRMIEWYLNEYKTKAAALVNNGQFLKSTYADISRLSWNLAESYHKSKAGE